MKNDNKKFIFLDREKLNSIPIQLEINSTSETLLSKYQDVLKSRIYSLYNKNIEECCFLIIETKTIIKKDDIPSFMELKVNKKTKIYNLLHNPQNYLYFLPKKKNKFTRQTKSKRFHKYTREFFYRS